MLKYGMQFFLLYATYLFKIIFHSYEFYGDKIYTTIVYFVESHDFVLHTLLMSNHFDAQIIGTILR
jgi:hypothetical protein